MQIFYEFQDEKQIRSRWKWLKYGKQKSYWFPSWPNELKAAGFWKSTRHLRTGGGGGDLIEAIFSISVSFTHSLMTPNDFISFSMDRNGFLISARIFDIRFKQMKHKLYYNWFGDNIILFPLKSEISFDGLNL